MSETITKPAKVGPSYGVDHNHPGVCLVDECHLADPPGGSTTHNMTGRAVGFIPGFIACSDKALLELESAMTEVICMSIELSKDMVSVQGDEGLAINEACQLQGSDARNQALCSGLPMAIGGFATFAVGGYASRPADCEMVDTQLGGLKQYEATLNATPEVVVGDEAPGRADVDEGKLQERLQEIQAGNGFAVNGRAANPSEVRQCPRIDGGRLSDEEVISMANPQERAALRKSFNKHNTTLREQRNTQMRMHLDKANTATAVAGGISSTMQGIGGSVSSRYQEDQKDEEGQAALWQSAQNISQGLAGQFRGSEDKRESEFNSVLQQMAAIAQANMVASAA